VALCGGVVGLAALINRGAEVAWNSLYAQYAEAAQAIENRLTKEVVVREVVPPSELELDDIIDEVSRQNHLNKIILRALITHESGDRIDRIRHEPHLMKRFKFPGYLNQIERELWASSVGPAQVIYGLWKDACGWQTLQQALDPWNNISCSAMILRRHLESKDVRELKTPAARLREALRRYNGTGEDAERYAEVVMGRVAGMLLRDLGEGV